MQEINYIDYLFFRKYVKQINSCLNESSTKYELPNKKIYHPHDKIIKTILDRKEEAIFLINQVLKLEEYQLQLQTKDIEKYNRKFITKTFENSEADVIYKMKNKNVFFLIEHQSKIDYAMPYRIMKYSIEIIESAIEKDKIGIKGYKYPNVYPIILYTGDKKWQANNSFNKSQEYLYESKEIQFLKYNLIDINQISERELLESKSFLGKILLIEKSKTQDKIVKSIEKVLATNLRKSDKEFLKNLIYYILKEKISEEEVSKFLEILESKEESNMKWMERLANAFDEKYEEGLSQGIKKGISQGMKKGISQGMKKGISQGMKKGLQQGISEGILSVAKNMLKKNMNIEEVHELTGLSKKQIQALK